MNLAHQFRGPLGQKADKPVRGTAGAKRWMDRVSALPCVICQRHGPSEVHHVICGRYGQRKASDFEVIPLCPSCHRLGPLAIHNGKESWVERNGPDYGFIPVVRALLDQRDEIDF